MDVPPGFPLLLVTSVSWGRDRRPFDYYTSWVRTDVVKVTVEAGAVGKMVKETSSGDRTAARDARLEKPKRSPDTVALKRKSKQRPT